MENTTEKKMLCKAKKLCGRLCRLRVKTDYSLSVSLYDAENGSSPECAHETQGSSDHSILKLVAVICAMSVIAAATSSICTMCKN